MTDLRIYVTELEKIKELYDIDQSKNLVKDSLIDNLKSQLINKDFIIINKDSIIRFQSSEINSLEKWGKEQEELKLKYKKRADNWFRTLTGGAIIGGILCLLLVK